MVYRCQSIQGCPKPIHLTLKQRLAPLVGKQVTVHSPNLPELRITGRLNKVTSRSFCVGKAQIDMNTSFLIKIHASPRFLMPYLVEAVIEDLGTFRGRLAHVGKDYVQFVQGRSKRTISIIPLNLFTDVRCEELGDE